MNSAHHLTRKALQIAPAYRTFRSKYKFLQKSQWWSAAKLEAYQLEQLQGLLTHAYDNVPYYTKVFDERGLKPRDILGVNDLELLPFLTKEIVRENRDALKARNYPPRAFEYVTTGGSSGTPLGFYYEKSASRAREWAFIRTLWGRVGYRFTDKGIIIRGNVVDAANKGTYWSSMLFGRWLALSSYHINNETLPTYIARMRAFKPKFVWAYPSTITMVAHFMKQNDIGPLSTVKAILCGSENLYQWQRDLLEETFHCRVFSWYGQSELGALAGECESSTQYHLFPEYGVTELIGRDGAALTETGERGEIVTTGFNNWIFPFIRYKTEDFGTYSESRCSCGRRYRTLDSIEGRRLQELIVGHNKCVYPFTALNMHTDVYDNVDQFQFYQEREGELTLRVVQGHDYTVEDSHKIRSELGKKLGPDMTLNIEFVDHINRTGRGKFKFVVQKVPIPPEGVFE